MKLQILTIFAFATAVFSKPQLISFGKEGKLGVNFGGYHAAVGGLLGGGNGGLFAEAGTPFGQAAKAGLGGAVNGAGHSAGGLYAGATAGGGVQASTGLSGGVTAEKSAGVGYASAQAGDHVASSGLGGESSIAGSSGFSFSGTKSFGLTSGVVKETEVVPLQPVEVVKPVKIHKEVHLEAENEVRPVVRTEVQPTVTLVKEVYVPQPVVQKTVTHVHRVKPHHFHKHAYFGGYVGGYVPPPPPPPPQEFVYKTVQVPVAQKRIDVVSAADVGAGVGTAVQTGGVGNVGFTKSVTFERNPTFFADIFNIPIQTLKAVGNFLGNAGGSTNISVQKTASIHAG